MAIKFLRKFGEYQSGQVCRLDPGTEKDYIRHGVAMRIAIAEAPEDRRAKPKKRRR